MYDTLFDTYGPFAVFLLLMLTGIGIPLGEDLITIPAGVLIGYGTLNPWMTVLCAYAGILLSDAMWYGVCYRFGTPLLHRRWFKRLVHPRRLLEVKHQIEHRGAWVVFMSRFVPGSRTPAITASGLLHMPFWRFIGASSAGCVFTVPMQLGLGYLIAKGIGTNHTADMVQTMVAIVILVLAIMLGLAIWRKYRSQHRAPPRAKARWLREFRVRSHRPAAGR